MTGAGTDVVEHANVDGNEDGKVSEGVDRVESEIANERMIVVESEGADWWGMNGVEVPMLIQTQEKGKMQVQRQVQVEKSQHARKEQRMLVRKWRMAMQCSRQNRKLKRWTRRLVSPYHPSGPSLVAHVESHN